MAEVSYREWPDGVHRRKLISRLFSIVKSLQNINGCSTSYQLRLIFAEAIHAESLTMFENAG